MVSHLYRAMLPEQLHQYLLLDRLEVQMIYVFDGVIASRKDPEPLLGYGSNPILEMALSPL
jgi:hypothetical protein